MCEQIGRNRRQPESEWHFFHPLFACFVSASFADIPLTDALLMCVHYSTAPGS